MAQIRQSLRIDGIRLQCASKLFQFCLAKWCFGAMNRRQHFPACQVARRGGKIFVWRLHRKEYSRSWLIDWLINWLQCTQDIYVSSQRHNNRQQNHYNCHPKRPWNSTASLDDAWCVAYWRSFVIWLLCFCERSPCRIIFRNSHFQGEALQVFPGAGSNDYMTLSVKDKS